MSEEEKEAIREAQNEIEVEKSVNCMFAKWLDIKDLQILLNYIEKLLKENEELKDIKLMKSVNINDNFISKDKIRNEIKELEEHLKDINDNVPKRKDGTPNRNINSGCRHYYEYKIEILEELLKESDID